MIILLLAPVYLLAQQSDVDRYRQKRKDITQKREDYFNQRDSTETRSRLEYVRPDLRFHPKEINPNYYHKHSLLVKKPDINGTIEIPMAEIDTSVHYFIK